MFFLAKVIHDYKENINVQFHEKIVAFVPITSLGIEFQRSKRESLSSCRYILPFSLQDTLPYLLLMSYMSWSSFLIFSLVLNKKRFLRVQAQVFECLRRIQIGQDSPREVGDNLVVCQIEAFARHERCDGLELNNNEILKKLPFKNCSP